MNASIWPRTDGDVILDFRLRKSTDSAGAVRPALVQVDTDGKELALLEEVRDGGGHLEMFRFAPSANTFDTVTSGPGIGKILIHPEGV